MTRSVLTKLDTPAREEDAMATDTNKRPFRFIGETPFRDIKPSVPAVVPDADPGLLSQYGQHMERMFRNRRLPAVIYKGATYPARTLGEEIEPKGIVA